MPGKFLDVWWTDFQRKILILWSYEVSGSKLKSGQKGSLKPSKELCGNFLTCQTSISERSNSKSVSANVKIKDYCWVDCTLNQRAQTEILLPELSITEQFLSFAAKIKLSASIIKRKWGQIISVNTIYIFVNRHL